MNHLLLQQEIQEKSQYINELRDELDQTNQGIVKLIIELEQESEKKLRDVTSKLTLLQQELINTDQGMLGLSYELDLAREKYRAILENASEAILTVDAITNIDTFNAAAIKLFGYSDLSGMSLKQIIPGLDPSFLESIQLNNYDQVVIKKTHLNETILCGQNKQGHFFPVELTIGAPFFIEKKSWIVILRDITERKKAEQGLRLMAKIFQNSNEAIMVTDINAIIVDVNTAFTEVTGYDREEVLGKNQNIMQSGYHDAEFYAAMWSQLIHSGKWRGEIWDKKKNGEIYPKLLSISAVKDENGIVTHYVGIFSDITQRKNSEFQLQQLAHYDQLTGLANRSLFQEKLQWAIDFANRRKNKFALFFLDLDRFKIINDTLGHHTGDQLLIEVAHRLKEATRKTDFVSRLAGDEFTVILTEISDSTVIARIAANILTALEAPLILADRELFITASIGITLYPEDGKEASKLLKNADTAMYHSKSLGKNTFSFYLDTMNQNAHSELELETNLRKALLNKEFMLYYQPYIEITSGNIVGMEALIRWQHPKLGFLPPTRFIPYAERSDLIILIGNWVLRNVCEHFMSWIKEGIPPIKISVNYSGVQLKQTGQIETITNILRETGMHPKYLALELTEGVAMENAENTIETMRALKHMGISISIDDFGTGYSSLSYLKRFPIDTLKIDRSFIKDIMENQDDSVIASTIIAMAHQLHLSVIAEGVETLDQFLELKAKGCDLIQGYFFCHPIPEQDIKNFILNYKVQPYN